MLGEAYINEALKPVRFLSKIFGPFPFSFCCHPKLITLTKSDKFLFHLQISFLLYTLYSFYTYFIFEAFIFEPSKFSNYWFSAVLYYNLYLCMIYVKLYFVPENETYVCQTLQKIICLCTKITEANGLTYYKKIQLFSIFQIILIFISIALRFTRDRILVVFYSSILVLHAEAFEILACCLLLILNSLIHILNDKIKSLGNSNISMPIFNYLFNYYIKLYLETVVIARSINKLFRCLLFRSAILLNMIAFYTMLTINSNTATSVGLSYSCIQLFHLFLIIFLCESLKYEVSTNYSYIAVIVFRMF